MPSESDVRNAVTNLSNVGRLVHLAYRMDSVTQQEIASGIFRRMRDEYEAELTRKAREVGCGQRQGQLSSGPAMSNLRATADEHAESIVNTFNLDLTRAIVQIRQEIPTANRNVYANRLAKWDQQRGAWKEPQISLMTHQFATQQARDDFIAFNDIIGQAIFDGPSPAAEPECQGLLNGNPHPLEMIRQRPTPIHLNCPHFWRIEKGRMALEDCADLWVGS